MRIDKFLYGLYNITGVQYCTKERELERLDMTKRNNSIEFFRFLFCCAICLHHFRGYGDGTVFISGYLGVDVFFVISGFFLMNHFMKQREESLESPEYAALGYLKDRLIRLAPHHVFSWIIMAILVIFVMKTERAADVLLYGCWEFFLLKATGLGNNISINGVVWYLSALIICSYLIYWVLCFERNRRKNDGQTYATVIAPILFFVVMGYLWSTRDHLNYWTQSAPILTGGFLRGISEMGLGCTVYVAVHGMREYFETHKRPDLLATVFELLGWALIFYHMFKQQDKRDFIVPALAAVLLVSVFSCRSYLSRLLDNPVSAFLGRISFPMFLNQFIFIRPICKYLKGYPFWRMAALMLIAVFLFSLFSDWLVRTVTEKVRKAAAAEVRTTGAD